MKLKNVLTLCILPLCLVSCGKKSIYKYEVREVSIATVPSKGIYGTELSIDLIGTNSLFVADSLLVADIQNGSKPYFFEIYNLNTESLVTGIGMYGRAKYEFLPIPVIPTRQYYTNYGDIIVPVNDNGLIKELNLTQSVSRNNAVIENTYKGYSYKEASTVILDNDVQFAYRYARPDDNITEIKDLLPKAELIKDGKVTRNIELFNSFMKDHRINKDQAEYYYWGKLLKKPDSDIVVLPMFLMNYILFFNLETDDFYAIHIDGSPTFQDGINGETALRCFFSATATSEYIYAKYSGDFNIVYEDNPDYAGRILKFDWEGNLIETYPIHDAVITDIAYSETNKKLYGLNVYSGDLYSFDF
jgi:hypothetical protein